MKFSAPIKISHDSIKLTLPVFIILLGIFCFAESSKAAILYVDALPAESGSGWDGVSGTAYIGSPGVGSGYADLWAAISAMSKGDKIYLRGGTYIADRSDENAVWQLPIAEEKQGDSWEENHYNYIGSYPGEWAVLNGNSQYAYGGVVLGFRSTDKTGGSALRYWIIERLEITGGNDNGGGRAGGIWMNRGPFKIRYCYVHDNQTSGSIDNLPTGITGYSWKDCVIEYNYVKDNGSTAIGVTNANAWNIGPGTDYQWARLGWTYDNGYAHVENNQIRYNLVVSTGHSGCGIRHKGAQTLAAVLSEISYQDSGDKIHHNIIEGHHTPIMNFQDFCQVYNNITHDTQNGYLQMNQRDSSTWQTFHSNFYNNTVIGSCFLLGDATGNCSIYSSLQNNIIDSFDSPESYYYSISLLSRHGGTCTDNDVVWDASHPITRNFIYQPADDAHFNIGMSGAERSLTASQFNVKYSEVSWSNDNNGLYVDQSGSGADRYRTSGSFILSGSVTIANGGIGGNHPYLDGVTIPSYIGATNPDDNGWVDDVMSFADLAGGIPTNLRDSLAVDLDDGEISTPDTTPPSSPSGLSVS